MIHLRPAIDDDIAYFFNLRNDPAAKKASRRVGPTWEQHVNWWETNTDYKYVALVMNVRVGILRVSADGMVSIIVDQKSRGLGYGTAMLDALKAMDLGFETLHAEVSYENLASQRAFTKSGWRPVLMEIHL